MTLTDWTNASIILLAVEAFILTLVPGLIFFFGIRGTNRLIFEVRDKSPLVLSKLREAARATEHASQTITAPSINLSAAKAQLSGWLSFFSARK
jgi:hypothetical protein